MRLIELLLAVGVLACGCGGGSPGGSSGGVAAVEQSLASSERMADQVEQTYDLTEHDMAFMHAMAVDVLERGTRAARDLEAAARAFDQAATLYGTASTAYND